MALLDICLTESDNRISQEESRGDIGVLNDINTDHTTNVSELCTIAPAEGGEVVSIFII